jgi:uncharacterized membrane protein
MSWYRQKVERDLARWQTAGWVSEAGASAIRTDLQSRTSAFGAGPILAILGAVLFGFAAMSFVAAHWTGMSKLARLALLLAGLWGCYAGAAYLLQRQLNAFAHAAILGGIAVYGASIMLIAQMYHMDGNPPDAILMWALGALLAAVLLRSGAALAATFVLLVVWTCWERGLNHGAHWSFLIAWGAAVAAAAWLRWRPGLHLAALSLIVWFVPLGYLILDRQAHWIVVLVGAATAAAAAAGGKAIDEYFPASAALFTYGLLTAFAGLYILQFINEVFLYGKQQDAASVQRLVLLAIITIGMLLAAMLWTLNTDNRAGLWLAYTAFALEIFTLYLRTFGSLLNTSLFFLVAAVIVSGLAWAAYKLHQRKAPTGAAA